MPKCFYKDGTTSDIVGQIDYNKVLHREDGPALIYGMCDTEYYLDGMLHNLNGPAKIIHSRTGISYQYYVYNEYVGSNLLPEEFEKLKNIKLKEITFK